MWRLDMRPPMRPICAPRTPLQRFPSLSQRRPILGQAESKFAGVRCTVCNMFKHMRYNRTEPIELRDRAVYCASVFHLENNTSAWTPNTTTSTKMCAHLNAMKPDTANNTL